MSLEATIQEHREMMRDELSFPPSQSRPPVAYTYDKTERAMVPDDRPLVINPLTSREVVVPDSATQSTQVGMPMSARMLRYLQGPTPDTPWSAALGALRVDCRRYHYSHRAANRPYWRGSLCHQAVWLTVVGTRLGPLTPAQAAGVLKVGELDGVLRRAFRFIEETIDHSRAKAERRAREDAGLGPGAVPALHIEQRHDMGGIHPLDCPKCRRTAA